MSKCIPYLKKIILLSTLRNLLDTIEKMRVRKDSELLTDLQKDAVEWARRVKESETKEELKVLSKEVSYKHVHRYSNQETYFEYWNKDTIFTEEFREYEKLDNIRNDLIDKFLWELSSVL
ncbi:MAG: hypothetical protein U0K95_00545 [Eubacterium sp.]|nr:hypothetical protein [Eubacterium sp.]